MNNFCGLINGFLMNDRMGNYNTCFTELPGEYDRRVLQRVRGEFLRAPGIRWLQAVSVPAGGQEILEHLRDPRGQRTHLSLQARYVPDAETSRAYLSRTLNIEIPYEVPGGSA